MSDTETETTENATQTKSGCEEAPIPSVTTESVTTESVTIERVADTALGALVSAAEALEAAVKLVRENGPAVAEAFERKGRPVRERIIEALRGTPFFAPTSPEPTDSSGVAATGSAATEISALERRVRELEQQIAGGDLAIEDAEIEQTTAQAATFNGEIWETPEERDFLADSPYAVSETSEEQAKEAEADGGDKLKTRARKKPVE